MMRFLKFSSLLTLLSGSVVADKFSTQRQTCAPLLTAHYDDCSLINFRRCPDGGLYIEAYTANISEWATRLGPDHELIYQLDMISGSGIHQVLEVTDAFSMKELLLNGSEQSDAILESSVLTGIAQRSRYQSRMDLTGEAVSISKHELLVVDASFWQQIGLSGGEVVRKGRFYLDQERQILVDGKFNATLFGEPYWETPGLVSLSFESDPQFMVDAFENACTAQLSQRHDQNARKMENNHDNL